MFLKKLPSLFSLAIILLFMFGCTTKTVEESISEAKQYIEQKDYDRAIIELKNAILQAPSEASTRIMLGQTYFDASQFANAEKEFLYAKDLKAEQDKYFQHLLKSIYYQNNFAEASLLSEKYKGSNHNVKSTAKLFGLLANTRLEGKINKISKDIIGDDLTIAKATIALLENKPSAAIKLISNLTDHQHELVEQSLISGLAYSAMGEFNKARESYNTAVEAFPRYFFVRFQLIEVLLELDEYDETKVHLDFLLDINKDSDLANFYLAKLLFKIDNFSEAIIYATKTLGSDINTLENNFIIGTSAYKLGQYETAYEYLRKNKNKVPDDHINNKILAEVSLKLGYSTEIIPQIETLGLTSKNKATVLSSAAISQFQFGNFEEASQFIEEANKNDPENAVLLLQEGLIKLSANDLSGLDSLASSIEYDASVNEAWLLMAETYVKNKEYEAAIQVAQKWQQINQIDGLILEGYIYLQSKQDHKAISIFKSILESEPENIGALRYLMLVKARNENYQEAKPLAYKLIELTPNDIHNVLNFINIHIATNEIKEAKLHLEKLLTKFPKNQEFIVGISAIYSYQNQLEDALQILSSSGDPNHHLIQRIMGDIYKSMRKYDEAYKQYDSWTKNRPKDPYAWFKKINVLIQQGKSRQGLDVTEQALNHFPNDPRIKAVHANFLTKQGHLDKASAIITEVQKYENRIPIIILYRGELELRKKNYTEAKMLLRTYYDIEPSFQVATLLAKALQHTNEESKGAEILKSELAKLESPFIEVHTVAEYLVENNMLSDAIKYYDAFLKDYPQHFITVNNYASALIKDNQLEKAQVLSTVGLNMRPNSPFSLDTHGWVLFKQGKVKESLFYLSKAYDLLPKNTEIQLHFAEALIKNRQFSKAKDVMKTIKATTNYEKESFTLLQESI